MTLATTLRAYISMRVRITMKAAYSSNIIAAAGLALSQPGDFLKFSLPPRGRRRTAALLAAKCNVDFTASMRY